MILNHILKTKNEVTTFLSGIECVLRNDAKDDFFFLLYGQEEEKDVSINSIIYLLKDIKNRLDKESIRYNNVFSTHTIMHRLDNNNLLQYYFSFTGDI